MLKHQTVGKLLKDHAVHPALAMEMRSSEFQNTNAYKHTVFMQTVMTDPTAQICRLPRVFTECVCHFKPSYNKNLFMSNANNDKGADQPAFSHKRLKYRS